MMTYRVLFICLLLGPVASGQIAFEASQSTITADFFSGAPVVCADMNGDGFDDLVRLDRGVDLCIDLLAGDAHFFKTYKQTIAENPEWNLVSGDLNNDGWPDMVTSGVGDRVKLISATPFSNGLCP